MEAPEIFGVAILIVMMVLFGVSALANAYELSQKHKEDDSE